jgi:hypothetical protein
MRGQAMKSLPERRRKSGKEKNTKHKIIITADLTECLCVGRRRCQPRVSKHVDQDIKSTAIKRHTGHCVCVCLCDLL